MTRFREAVSLRAYTYEALSDLMVKVFSAAHKSGKFIRGEEPLIGQHVTEAVHSAPANVLNQAFKKACERHILPLHLLCL